MYIYVLIHANMSLDSGITAERKSGSRAKKKEKTAWPRRPTIEQGFCYYYRKRGTSIRGLETLIRRMTEKEK